MATVRGRKMARRSELAARTAAAFRCGARSVAAATSLAAGQRCFATVSSCDLTASSSRIIVQLLPLH